MHRSLAVGSARVLLVTAAALSLPLSGLAQDFAGTSSAPELTRDTIDAWMGVLSNTGRWGPDDERGTLNLITPAHVVRAAALVTEGRSVSLSHDYLKEPAADATSPLRHEISGVTGSGAFVSDRIDIDYHGFAHSHIDALCHMSHEGRMYNGLDRGQISEENGCEQLGVTVMKEGIVARGVLVDLPLLRGVEYLEPGTGITPADLEEWEAFAGVTIGEGDVVLVRAGRWARRAEEGPWATVTRAAGLNASAAPWLHERGVAVLGSDYTNDQLPSGIPGVFMPIHQLALVAMGMPLFDNLDLEAVAGTASELGRWEFLFVAAPLAVPGGTGSPLNPLAIF